MKKTLVAISAVAALAIGSVAPALAYPAGQSPTLNLSSVSRLTPGDNVSVVVARVKKNCSVSVSWNGVPSIDAVTATVRNNGKTPVMTIKTPSTAGEYTLKTSTISQECSGESAVSFTKKITVGKFASIVSKLKTTSGYASKNPKVSISGTVKSGSLAVGNKSVSIAFKRDGITFLTTTAETNAQGAFSEIFQAPGLSYSAGVYTAVVTLSAGTVYASKSAATAGLTLR